MVLLLGAVCLEAFSEGMLGAMLPPILPDYAETLGASPFYIDLLFTLFPFAVLIGSPLCGWLSGRVGRRGMMYFGIILSGSTSILFGVTHSLVLLGIFRFCQGIGSAATWSATYALLADYYPSRKTMVIGFTETATGLGSMAGPVLSAWLADLGSFALPFYVVGGILLFPLGGLVMVLGKKKKKSHGKHKQLQGEAAQPFLQAAEKDPWEEFDFDSSINLSNPNNAEEGEGEVAPQQEGLKGLFNPILVTCSLAILFIEACTQGLAPKMEAFMDEEFDLSVRGVGLVLSAASITYTFLAPTVSIISRKIGALSTMILGLLLIAASLILMGPMPGMDFGSNLGVRRAVLVTSFALSGMGTALAFVPTLPLMLQSVVHLGPEATGLVSGSFYAIFSVGQCIGPIAGGMIHAKLGFEWTSALLGGVMLIFVPFMLCMRSYLSVISEEAVQEAMEETVEDADAEATQDVGEGDEEAALSPRSGKEGEDEEEEEEVYEEGWEKGYGSGWNQGYRQGMREAQLKLRAGHHQLPHSVTMPLRQHNAHVVGSAPLPKVLSANLGMGRSAHQLTEVKSAGPLSINDEGASPLVLSTSAPHLIPKYSPPKPTAVPTESAPLNEYLSEKDYQSFHRGVT